MEIEKYDGYANRKENIGSRRSIDAVSESNLKRKALSISRRPSAIAVSHLARIRYERRERSTSEGREYGPETCPSSSTQSGEINLIIS